MAGNGAPHQHTIPPKDLDWWSEDAMVRFGTNTQRLSEPAWQDVGANVLRMDSLYDASFHDWLKCEDNVSIIASYLQRIANEYPMDRIVNALRWLVSSWRVESTAVVVRHITSDWAVSPNAPKATPPMPFRLEPPPPPTLPPDPATMAGEARRGLLVRELTKDWSCQQIAQLVGMLSLTFWSERTYLEAFLRTLVSDWDFCRLSSFFSYVSSQLGLDYRVKVSMLQQAARRNASRLSLKRARNGASATAVAALTGPSDESPAECDDGSNKRLRHDPAELASPVTDAAEATSASASVSASAAAAVEPHANAPMSLPPVAPVAVPAAAHVAAQSPTIATGATDSRADLPNSSPLVVAPPQPQPPRRSSLASDETTMDCNDDADSQFAPRAPSADALYRQSDPPHGPSLAPAEAEYQLSSPPQPRRRPRNPTTRSPTMPSTSSLLGPAPAAPAASFGSQAPSPSDPVPRRPLTPHLASTVFDVTPETHPSSLTARRHRHNRSYQNRDCAQPLTPTHSSTSLATFTASGVEVTDPHGSPTPGQLAPSSTLLPRPALRLHAASISSAGGGLQPRHGGGSDSSAPGPSAIAAEPPQAQAHEQKEQPAQPQPPQEYRARTASEGELGQFDGPPSTHLALPLPSESPANAPSLCSRTTAAPYDVLGIVMADSEHHIAEPSA